MSDPTGPRIIFVCTGNICRSPLAERVAQQKFAGLGLSFASAGLAAPAGHPASRHAADWGAGRGLDLSGHAARPVAAGLLADTAWVIGMTRSHAAIFRSRWGRTYPGAIGVLGAPGVDLAGRTHSPDGSVEVDDPYGRDLAAYAACGALIEDLLGGWTATFTALARRTAPDADGKGTG